MPLKITIAAYRLEMDDLRRFLEWRYPGFTFDTTLVCTLYPRICRFVDLIAL